MSQLPKIPTGERDSGTKSISLDLLVHALRELPTGVSGIEREDLVRAIDPLAVASKVDADVRVWPGINTVTAFTASQLNKLIDRNGLPVDQVDRRLDAQLADKISRIAVAANFPTSKAGERAVSRLVLSLDTEDAEYYLSDDFVVELQDMAAGNTELETEIGNFYSVKRLLRRSLTTRDPLDSVRRTVKKVVEITENKQRYVESVCGTIASSKYVAGLTNNLLLEAATDYGSTLDETIESSAIWFDKISSNCPLLAQYDASYITQTLIKAGPNGTERVQAIAESIEAMLHRYIDGGGDNRTVISYLIRSTGGNEKNYWSAITKGNRTTALAAFSLSERYPRTTGQTARRIEAAINRGRLTAEDYDAVGHGRSYRDTLLEIDESEHLADDEKEQIFSRIRAIRRFARDFSDHLKPVVGNLADQIYEKFSQRLTEVLYSAKYVTEHGDTPQTVPMGSKEITYSLSPREIIRSEGHIIDAMQTISQVRPETNGHDEPLTDNIIVGYVRGTQGKLMLATKRRYDISPDNRIRGKSARVNLITGMGSLVPSPEAGEREQTSLSIRFDYSDGQLVLDLGGKTNSPYAPDVEVAKTISLGAWLRGKELGQDDQDYHIAVVPMTEQEFDDFVMAFRRAYPIE